MKKCRNAEIRRDKRIAFVTGASANVAMRRPHSTINNEIVWIRTEACPFADHY